MLEKAKAQGLRYLTIRVRTEKEMRQYLLKKGYPNDLVDQVIDYLYSYNYLDDYKYCQLWIEERIRLNPCGRKKMYVELRKKGLASDLIKEALRAFYAKDVELVLALDFARKKKDQGQEGRKIENFLQYRGFSAQIITDVMENVDNK